MTSEKQQDLWAQIARLPKQIKEYYSVYFSVLRSQLNRDDLFFNVVPNHLRGYKRVISIGGRDGLVVVHFPIELEITISKTDTGEVLIRFPSIVDAREDVFEFVTFPRSPVKDLVGFVNDGEDTSDVMPSEEQWGRGVAALFDRPLQVADVDTGQPTWRASWTRLTFADLGHLDFWEDNSRAEWEAKKDVEIYVRDLERKELDDVVAPKALDSAGVKAGDRGVVIEKFERPEPALLVEFADLVGQTKALVTYSESLEEVLDILVDKDLQHRQPFADQHEQSPTWTHEFASNSPMKKGLVPA